jgi:uncharacterized protein (DUF2336 family)
MSRSEAEDAIDYETAKTMARSTDRAVRQRLAARGDIRPELLYFLANDQAVEVRREIAANVRTPRKADLLLAGDSDTHVRTGLARKIARLAPDLPPERLDQIERMTLDILETLARDQATEVRRILADELKDVATAPATVINLLARDVELNVCGPVLRNSPILTDEDLLEIIFGHSPDGALSAIAERANVGVAVVDAIAASDDAGAIAVLLVNPSAQIREETLDRIIDRATQNEPWHGPLVRRPKLPARAAARLATFVADSLLQVLQTRTDLGLDAARQVAESVRHRLIRHPSPQTVAVAVPPAPLADDIDPPWATAPTTPVLQPPVGPVDPPWAQAAACEPPETTEYAARSGAGSKGGEKAAERPAADRVARLHAEGRLDETVITAALSEGDRLFVTAALARLLGTSVATVDRVLATHGARPVTALVWRAGLSMRLARQIQLRLAQIPPKDTLNPRNGTEYPLAERDMRWQLEFFGIT